MRRIVSLLLCLGAISCGGIAEDTRGGGDRDDSQDPSEDEDDPPPDCSGTFGEAELFFEDPGWLSQALTPSADGLEFYYARLALDPDLDDSGTRLPTVRRRASADAEFGEPVLLSALATTCEAVRPGTEFAAFDLSVDGKRLYMGCSDYGRVAGSSGPLLLFERTATDESFVTPPLVIGEVGISVGLTRDELTAFAMSLDPNVNAVVRYDRSSVAAPFGEGKVVSGTRGLANPEPAPDGSSLWGVSAVPGGARLQIVVFEWDASTESYQATGAPLGAPPEGTSDVSPALSRDCRAVYFSRITHGPFPRSQVMVARR